MLIAIKKDLVSSEITELKTNCEIVWAEENIAGSKNLQGPPSDKGQALEQLQSSINTLHGQSNATVIIGGDFNLGHIYWSNNCTITGRPDQSDDSVIYMPIKSQHDCNKLQQDIDAAARWESNWLMAFHFDKCSVLSVTKKKQPIHNYILHIHILQSVSSPKYLGITVQSDLK